MLALSKRITHNTDLSTLMQSNWLRYCSETQITHYLNRLFLIFHYAYCPMSSLWFRAQDEKKPQMRGFKIHGGRRGIRTLDTRIFSPLLYQLSYPTSMYAQMSSDASRYSTHYPFFGQAFCSTCTVKAIKSERIGAFAHKPPVRYVLFAHTILCSNRRILLGFFQNEGVCDKSFAVDPLRMRSR